MVSTENELKKIGLYKCQKDRANVAYIGLSGICKFYTKGFEKKKSHLIRILPRMYMYMYTQWRCHGGGGGAGFFFLLVSSAVSHGHDDTPPTPL